MLPRAAVTSQAAPSYPPHDETRIRAEIEELREYKETELRAERQFLEHRKEHAVPESLCPHCRQEETAARAMLGAN